MNITAEHSILKIDYGSELNAFPHFRVFRTSVLESTVRRPSRLCSVAIANFYNQGFIRRHVRKVPPDVRRVVVKNRSRGSLSFSGKISGFLFRVEVMVRKDIWHSLVTTHAASVTNRQGILIWRRAEHPP